MGATYSAKIGNKGRLVIPAGLREKRGWTEDTVLVLVDEGEAVVMMTIDDLEKRVQGALRGSNVLEKLYEERRTAAQIEDSE